LAGRERVFLNLVAGKHPSRYSSAVRLNRIQIFPVKSLDGICLSESTITAGGILKHDREWAIFDDAGRVVNGKRTARVHDLGIAFNDKNIEEIQLWQRDESVRRQFVLSEPRPLKWWLSEFFGFKVEIRRDAVKGFPDDCTAFGPTIASEASLRAIQSWFPELDPNSIRRRFRTNLVLEGNAAFCEDELFGAPEQLKPFRIGPVMFLGHNPCQRCVVPTRDPDTGKPMAAFQKKFMEERKKHLPAWANAERFNHFYRFAVNTSVPPTETGKVLRVGDVVVL